MKDLVGTLLCLGIILGCIILNLVCFMIYLNPMNLCASLCCTGLFIFSLLIISIETWKK